MREAISYSKYDEIDNTGYAKFTEIRQLAQAMHTE